MRCENVVKQIGGQQDNMYQPFVDAVNSVIIIENGTQILKQSFDDPWASVKDKRIG